MTYAESDAFWRKRLKDQMVRHVRSAEFLSQLQFAHSEGLLEELLLRAGALPLRSQCESGGVDLTGNLTDQSLHSGSARHLGYTAG